MIEIVFLPKLDEQFYIDKNPWFPADQAMYTGGSSGLPTTTEEVTGSTLRIKTTWA